MWMVKIFQSYLGKRLSKFLLISFCPSLLGKLKPETQKRRKKKRQWKNYTFMIVSNRQKRNMRAAWMTAIVLMFFFTPILFGGIFYSIIISATPSGGWPTFSLWTLLVPVCPLSSPWFWVGTHSAVQLGHENSFYLYNDPYPDWHSSAFFQWITAARGGPAIALGISCSFPSNRHE